MYVCIYIYFFLPLSFYVPFALARISASWSLLHGGVTQIIIPEGSEASVVLHSFGCHSFLLTFVHGGTQRTHKNPLGPFLALAVYRHPNFPVAVRISPAASMLTLSLPAV